MTKLQTNDAHAHATKRIWNKKKMIETVITVPKSKNSTPLCLVGQLIPQGKIKVYPEKQLSEHYIGTLSIRIIFGDYNIFDNVQIEHTPKKISNAKMIKYFIASE
jgi:hypothetical protein